LPSAALAAGTFIAMAFGRWPLLWTLLLFGGVGCVWAWAQLAREDRRAASASSSIIAESAAPSPKPPPGSGGDHAPKA
jgi:hypothetical protein